MRPPFSADQFFEVFALYNSAVWPMQAILLIVGMTLAVLAVSDVRWRGKVISSTLALLWTWMALAYHWAFFSAINPAAKVFGVMFLVQGVLFLWFGLRRGGLSYEFYSGPLGYLGGLLIVYGLVIYPVLGIASGRAYMNQPTFGLPCPTTIFTMGVLLWARPRVPWPLLVVPAAWSVIGFTAVSAFGVLEDIVMPLAVLIGGTLLLRRHIHAAKSAPA